VTLHATGNQRAKPQGELQGRWSWSSYQRTTNARGTSAMFTTAAMCCWIKDCGPPPSPVLVPNPVRARRPIEPGLDELRMQEEPARQMEKFWTLIRKVTSSYSASWDYRLSSARKQAGTWGSRSSSQSLCSKSGPGEQRTASAV
jgi:hypothetical protein